ncbi:MAG: hypothetical protein Q9169_007682 [Polycauliona sp. 2 TL-2023]
MAKYNDDDTHSPPLRSEEKRREIKWLLPCTAASMTISIIYLAYRTHMLVFSTTTQEVTIAIWLALSIEMAIAVPRLIGQFSMLGTLYQAKGARLPPPPPPPRSISNDANSTQLPRIDILITYCGEGLHILTDTVVAACRQDGYPASQLRIIVLDDSSDADVADAVTGKLYQSLAPSVHYATRNVKHSTHSKAANLNFGLNETVSLPGGSAPYLAVLDVDMMPSPHWLRTMLAPLLSDPSAAQASPFQRFYNIAPNDPLSMSTVLMGLESVLVLQDAADSSLCLGTGFLVRRAALDSINGFPEGSLTEDLLTTVALAAKGWHTVYVEGDLQWGLAPASFPGCLAQRMRLIAGITSFATYLCSGKAKDVPFAARLSGAIWGIVDIFSAVVWAISIFLLPVLVLSGHALLPSSSSSSSSSVGISQIDPLMFRLAILDFAAQSAVQALLCSLVDWRCEILARPMVPPFGVWMAPYRLLITFRYFCLPRLPAFAPTGINAALGKEEIEARKRGGSCLKVVLWNCGAWIFLIPLGCCLLAGFRATEGALGPWFYASSEDKIPPVREVLDGFLVRVGWPPLFYLWLLIANSAWTPISYALAPPPVVEREQLLDRTEDQVLGRAEPKKKVKEDHLAKKPQNVWAVFAAYHIISGVVFEAVR